jgi:cyclic pyranopterin phosphate synthase
MCLGQDDHVDLRAALREGGGEAGLAAALQTALAKKPQRHDFFIDAPGLSAPQRRHSPARTMSMTGG